MIFKAAFKNIIGAGKRTWLNVMALSLTFVLMTGYNGIEDGWKEKAWRDSKAWETGAAHLWHPHYDRYDIFTLSDAHGPIPQSLQPYINNKALTPILVTQGVIYPQGRMLNVLLQGIDPEQTILKIPSSELLNNDNELVAIIGTRMAESSRLHEGDRVMLRWRDHKGSFDACEVSIAKVFHTTVPNVDNGQFWIDINQLQKMTGMYEEATYLVASDQFPYKSDVDGWLYKGLKFLLADFEMVLRAGRIESFIIFGVLLAIALLAVFDTQTLAIFRRQKEIGTYVALGMTPTKVSLLFTLEGTCFSILAIMVSIVWGTPAMAIFAKTGYKMPEIVGDIGMAIGNVMYPAFKTSSILISAGVIVSLSAVISYLPARKIAKQNVVEALKGKIV